jgi:GTP pyrophosphokinase
MNDYSALIKTNIESLFGYLAPRTSEEQMHRIIDGYEFAAKAHQKQKRRSGEPYIIHPIAVATILAKELEMTDNTVIAAFLHDVVEDTDHTIEEIEERFGSDVAKLVDAVTKRKKANYEYSKQVDNYRLHVVQHYMMLWDSHLVTSYPYGLSSNMVFFHNFPKV